MNVAYPTDEIPATTEYVLEVINAVIRSGRPGKDQQPLTLDMTIGEWFKQTDGISRFVPLACTQWYEDLLEGLFGSFLPETTAMRLTRTNTLRDLCQPISDRMGTRQAIRPWRRLVGESRAAGAFLTLRSVLAKYGADVSNLSPSTPLNDPELGCYLLGIDLDLIRLTPETHPAMETGCRRRDRFLSIAVLTAVFILLMATLIAAALELEALILSLFACIVATFLVLCHTLNDG